MKIAAATITSPTVISGREPTLVGQPAGERAHDDDHERRGQEPHARSASGE